MKTTILTIAASIALVAHGLCADATPTPTPQPDKLKEALAELITGVTQTASDAKTFVVAQLPDVVRQLLVWKFFQNLIPMIFFAVVFIVVFTAWLRAFKAGDWNPVYTDSIRWSGHKDCNPQNGYPKMIFGIVKAALTVISAFAFLFSVNLTWLQIWIAPKVYLIEFAKDLIHK